MRIHSTLLVAIATLFLLSACGGGSRTRDKGPFSGYPEIERPEANGPKEIPDTKESVAKLFKKAEGEVKKKEYDLAKITLKQITLREPRNLKAHERYQDILFLQKRHLSAYHEFYDMMASDEEDGVYLYLFARTVLAKRPNTQVQTQELDDATKAKVEVHFTNAQAQINEGNRAGAISQLYSLTKLVPEHIAAHRLLQDLELAQTEHSRMGTAFEVKASELSQRYQELMQEHEVNGDMVYLYERVASLQEPLEESLRLSTLRFMRAVALDLQGYWLYYGFARACAERAAGSDDDTEKLALLKLSESLYEVCTNSDELIAEGWFGLGLSQLAMRKFKDAEASLAFAIDLNEKKDPEILVSYGEVLERQNKNDAALAAYKDAAKLHPKDYRFVYGQGRVMFVKGETAIALALFEKTLGMLGEADADFAERLRETIERIKEG